MAYLLDVNVLIALIDPSHVQHNHAHSWFERTGQQDWATCPLTQNGVLRIVGHSRYPNSPGAPDKVAKLVEVLLQHPGHHFWPDSISLLDHQRVHTGRLVNSSQVTDSYLLALAVANQGKLATFDQSLAADKVTDGPAHLHIIRESRLGDI